MQSYAKPVQCPSPTVSTGADIQGMDMGETQAKAFQAAKETLTSSTVLTHNNLDLWCSTVMLHPMGWELCYPIVGYPNTIGMQSFFQPS